MSKIKVELEITGLEGWDVDWNFQGDVDTVLDELKKDIKCHVENMIGDDGCIRVCEVKLEKD